MIVIGMAALGVLVGVFAAWSATPIVTTLLPLLFGIVGGVSGVSIAKMDVSASKSQLKIKLLGQMLAAFSIACTLAVVLAVYLRPRVQELDQITLVYGKSSADYVDALILRRKLGALGASPTEVGYVFKLLNAEDKPDLVAIDKKIDEVLGRTFKSAAASTVGPPSHPGADKDDENLKRMADPDQWPAPWNPSAPKPSTENEKWKFPLAYEQWKADPSGATLWGYKMPDGEQLLLLPSDSWRGG